MSDIEQQLLTVVGILLSDGSVADLKDKAVAAGWIEADGTLTGIGRALLEEVQGQRDVRSAFRVG